MAPAGMILLACRCTDCQVVTVNDDYFGVQSQSTWCLELQVLSKPVARRRGS